MELCQRSLLPSFLSYLLFVIDTQCDDCTAADKHQSYPHSKIGVVSGLRIVRNRRRVVVGVFKLRCQLGHGCFIQSQGCNQSVRLGIQSDGNRDHVLRSTVGHVRSAAVDLGKLVAKGLTDIVLGKAQGELRFVIEAAKPPEYFVYFKVLQR